VGRFDGGKLQFIADLSEAIGRNLYFYGFYEQTITAVVAQLLLPGQVFIDIGANFGYFTLFAARRVQPRGRVFAFEPDPTNLRLLHANIALNKLPNVVVEETAVAASEGECEFFPTVKAQWSRGKASTVAPDIGAPPADTMTVRTVSLDEYCDVNAVERVDVVKMDIEGGEALAIEGMGEGIRRKRYRRVLLELHSAALRRLGVAPEDLLRRFLDNGYRCFRIRNARSGWWGHYSLRFDSNLLIEDDGKQVPEKCPHYLVTIDPV